MIKVLICIALLISVWQLFFNSTSKVVLSPGVMVAEAPVQKQLMGTEKTSSYSFKEYMVTPLANFEIKAKVLGKENYTFDRGAKLSPVDLALGWQNMSDQAVVDQIEISQSNRWYRWRVDEFPIARQEIETQSANMHMIPRDNSVKRQLAEIREGQIIQLGGQLVSVKGEDGFQWRSSLTRDDVGARACELIMVEWISVIHAI